MALNAKQQIFVAEYLIDKNATRAAIAAGYPKRSASTIGGENLRKPQIKKAIAAALGPKMKKLEITAERILNEIASVAFTDLTKKKKFMPIRASDKMKALELLAKNQKLLTDVQEVTGKDGGPQVIAYIPDNGRVKNGGWKNNL